MSGQPRIPVPHAALVRFCCERGISRMAFFGSVLRDDFTPESDVDVLVEFLPGRAPGLITLAGYEIELSRILGRRADLNTRRMLGRYHQPEALSEVKLGE